MNNEQEKHLCPVCGKECKRIFCSKECRYSEKGLKIIQEKMAKTNLERYGFITPSKNKNVKEKSKQSFMKKYGVENPNQNEEIKEKRKRTCLKRYGVDNPAKNETCKEKCKKTNLERYGVENPSSLDICKEKCKKTNIERYGVENPNQNKEIQEKKKQTCLEKYGVEFVLQSDDVKDKSKKTNIERYGVSCPMQNEEIKNKSKKNRRINKFDIFIQQCKNSFITPLFDKDAYIGAKRGSILKFHCERCGKNFKYKMDKHESFLSIQHIFCPDQTHKVSSKAEQEIYDWLISIGIANIERNKRDWGSNKMIEADIYLPDYKLAIEYDGIFWHSNLKKDKNYHLEKYNFFKDQNIDCIQIFENEWRDKPNIVKGIILNKLGKCKKIYARNCIIKEIPNNEYEMFLNQNHIQGYHQAKIKLGLFCENELVEVMSFSKPRFNKKYDWENIRTCTKVGYYVIGGFSRLLNFFKKNYNGSIISYIDKRLFNGEGYIKNGFIKIECTHPNYFYFKNNEFILYNRIDFQKHKLKNKLELYDENLSEQENMSMNNYLWIYDCGNDVLVCE